MTTAIKRRRGTTTQHATFTGLEGELTVDTTKDTVVVHDGATAGGFPLAKESQATTNVAITGGTISGITDLAVADGGTGASTAADARTNLGVTATGADTSYAFRANNLSDLASASTARTNLGLGTIATQAASSVAITGGTIDNTVIGGSTRAAVSSTNLAYTGTLTGGTGVVNLGSGQFYKDASGNVGIGTSSPARKLDIYDATAPTFSLHNSTSGTTSSDGFLLFTLGSDVTLLNYESGYMGFSTAATERMRITSSGEFLVATTTAQAGLASDAVGVTIYGGGNAGASVFCRNSTGSVIIVNNKTASSGLLLFYNGGNSVGSITSNGTTTSYNTTSDYRLKENIAPMTGALDVVQQLKPVTYNWKVNGSSGQGFIAHELQAVVPDCVTGEKDAVDKDGKPVYQGIDTSFLVATLTKAIQEQQTLIENLTTRLTALEGN